MGAFVRREHPGWLQTEEGLWLPTTFLVGPVATPSAAEQEAAHESHGYAADVAFGRAPDPATLACGMGCGCDGWSCRVGAGEAEVQPPPPPRQQPPPAPPQRKEAPANGAYSYTQPSLS